MSLTSFFETIKIEDGVVFHLEYHQKRYESVLRSFGHKKFVEIASYINPPPSGLHRCRFVYTLANEIKVSYYKYKKREVNQLKLVYDNRVLYREKSMNREELTRLFEQREECDDILIVKNDYITDTSIANIALYDGKDWFTPRKPLLKGTTRARLLEEKKLIEADITPSMLKNYSQVALLNAMIDFDILADISFKM